MDHASRLRHCPVAQYDTERSRPAQPRAASIAYCAEQVSDTVRTELTCNRMSFADPDVRDPPTVAEEPALDDPPAAPDEPPLAPEPLLEPDEEPLSLPSPLLPVEPAPDDISMPVT